MNGSSWSEAAPPAAEAKSASSIRLSGRVTGGCAGYSPINLR
jgi:hypothetical protein